MNSNSIDKINLETVFVCYGKLNPETIFGYRYVIIESFFYTQKEIQQFKEHNENVFAYLSLGEVNVYSKFYEKLKPLTIGTNENWNSFLLNLQAKETIAVLTEAIDEFILMGYSGVFFDNLDNFGIFGQQTNQRCNLLAFIENMNSRYPNHLFIQNAGLEFIDSTHKLVDAIVFESVASQYDFESKSYHLCSQKEFDIRQKEINEIGHKYQIPVLVIEYADSYEDYNEIKKRLYQNKLNFFVGNIDLQTIPNYN